LTKQQSLKEQKGKVGPVKEDVFASRSLRKREPKTQIVEEKEDDDDEEEEDYTPARKRQIVEKPATAKKEPSPRATRTRNPPKHLENVPEPVKRSTKNIQNAIKKPAVKSFSGPLSARQRRSGRIRNDSEPSEYVCDSCQEVFNSKVKFALHELEHSGRFLQIELIRCDVTANSLLSTAASQAPNFSSSEEDESTEKQRNRRKSQSPRKNLSQDEITDENDKRHNFVFVAPLLVAGPKKPEINKCNSEPVKFGFDSPIMLKGSEDTGEFSDGENDESNNVAECISSLEKNEENDVQIETGNGDNNSKTEGEIEEHNTQAQAVEDAEDGENTGDIPVNKDDSVKKNDENKSKKKDLTDINQDENLSEISSDDNLSIKSTDLKEEEETQATTNGHEEKPEEKESEHQSATKSNVLKLDFDDSIKTTSVMPQTKNTLNVSNVLSFDFEEALPKKMSDVSSTPAETKLANKNLEQENSAVCSGLTTAVGQASESCPSSGENAAMGTTNTLREDSENPTLPQSQNDANCPFPSVANRIGDPDLSHLEKMMSDVVGE
jgi:hypothetical protein